MNMSMTEKIKAGKLFTDMCEGLPEKRLRGKTLMYEFNHSHPSVDFVFSLTPGSS